jgi:hypothetical protein
MEPSFFPLAYTLSPLLWEPFVPSSHPIGSSNSNPRAPLGLHAPITLKAALEGRWGGESMPVPDAFGYGLENKGKWDRKGLTESGRL